MLYNWYQHISFAYPWVLPLLLVVPYILYWYFKNINNEFDTLFPKIKVKEFNSLPLPIISNKEISNKVKEILKSYSFDFPSINVQFV